MPAAKATGDEQCATRGEALAQHRAAVEETATRRARSTRIMVRLHRWARHTADFTAERCRARVTRLLQLLLKGGRQR